MLIRDYSELVNMFHKLDAEVQQSFPSDEGLVLFLQGELGCNYSVALNFVMAWHDFNSYYGQ